MLPVAADCRARDRFQKRLRDGAACGLACPPPGGAL